MLSVADDHFDDRHFREFYAEYLPQCLAVTGLGDRHGRRMAEDFRQQAFPSGREVQHHDEAHAGIRGSA